MEIGIEKKNMDEVVKMLEKLLADQHILYQKLRNFHWNVRGPNFPGLHMLFENQYNSLNEDIDVVAERIRMMGAFTKGTLKEYLEMASLKEKPREFPNAMQMIQQLLGDNETLIKEMREFSMKCGELGDIASEGVLTGFVEKHEKFAWMLRSMLEK
jgi:starvation-inducible DNA-binding protein